MPIPLPAARERWARYYRVAPANSTGTAPIGPGVGGAPYIPAGIVGWRYTHFGAAGLNPTVANGAADLADPANDGFCNLLKYALGMDPAISYSAASSLVPAVALQPAAGSKYLTLGFTGVASDVTYAVDFSSDLSAWQTVYTSNGSFAPGSVIVQDSQPITASSNRFARLRVTGN
jgi:hypothetical protein